MLGLKRNEVKLVSHNPDWNIIAAQIIKQLWKVFGSNAEDIQHIGSTAIRRIKAKPDMYIAVGVKDMYVSDEFLSRLEEIDLVKIENRTEPDSILIVKKSEIESGVHTLYVHILPYGSSTWNENINFRDYMNDFPQKALSYENLKISLAEQFPNDRRAYKNGKVAFFKEYFIQANIYKEFKQKFDIVNLEPLNKGWSADKKYIIETVKGEKQLIRIADITEYDRKKAEYGMAERVYNLGVPTPKPIDFGFCKDGQKVYSIFTWLEGDDAQTILPHMSESEQYDIGIKAGKTLRKIHSLPAPNNAEPWAEWFWRKVQGRIDFYNTNPVKSDSGDILVQYLQENKHLLDTRPQTFNHGDFNASNLIILPDKQIGVIDFNYYNKDHGDPWWEFDPSMDGWGSEPSASYITGLIKGYFAGEPPSEFFVMLSYYLAYDALAALCDTSVGEGGGPEDGNQHTENILRWFGNMKNPIPSWYLSDFYV